MPQDTTPVQKETIASWKNMYSGPLTAAEVKTMAQQDPLLPWVHSYVLCGGPDTVDSSFNPYSSHRHELSVCKGCVLWGNRVIIPKAGRQMILDELHDSHQGACRMKERARILVWWLLMNKYIETIANSCMKGQVATANATLSPMDFSRQIMHGVDYIWTMHVPHWLFCMITILRYYNVTPPCLMACHKIQ